jgi:hydroxymethylpyrimidine pyrophosphatase-like HAD family hydrolase
MSFRVLATDYDGTIAFEGKVDGETVSSLRTAAAAGLAPVLVTGRELTDLFNTFEHGDVFRYIVAENGAVLYDPRTRHAEMLAAAPPAALIERLTEECVPLSVGHSIVATVEPHEQAVMAAIHDLALDWHVIFNNGSVMALPSDVTKATGLSRALDALQVTWTDAIAVGDAENDLAFMRRCGLAVAVQNALPTVKDLADMVTDGARGAGVIELIARWRNGELGQVAVNPARVRVV